ncbi:hypothetical protein [Carboxylicivirga marina]|uniref:hypothetical protein n=1 Tax=Carboxylicivirga marina TaxID=2800988 RepID=UPI00259963AE|nr:hypothetical protein [uncultured Carboxylicivirga sp.]
MKYLLFVCLFCCQLLTSQNNTNKCDSISTSSDKLQPLKPITGIRVEDKFGTKKRLILSKYKVAKIGDVAYDFTAINVQGDSVKFSNAQGEFKLLIFTNT